MPKEIKDKLYEKEHQRNISEEETEKKIEYLRKLVRILNKKNIVPVIAMILIMTE